MFDASPTYIMESDTYMYVFVHTLLLSYYVIILVTHFLSIFANGFYNFLF